MIPDRRGNNRIDTLRNIVRDPRIALLFLIPGIGRTLRINGRAAHQRRSRALRLRSPWKNKVPRSADRRHRRERLHPVPQGAGAIAPPWDASRHLAESALPSSGTMMKALQAEFDAETHDREYPQRLKETIY